jgi:tRNA(Ser,Leu) C12 N-acetylase TAN1
MAIATGEDPSTSGDPGTDRADWNVVVTLPEATFREARALLRDWGAVSRTPYYNVLALKVADPVAFLAGFARLVQESPGILNLVSHVVPAQRTFDFASADEFEAKAREIVLEWGPALVGKAFHVRLCRRGLKGSLSSPKEERLLDDALLAATEAAGGRGRIAFDDPDAIIRIETIDGRAGMSLWTRDDLRGRPFLPAG